jgi:probable F420-dependent oxidoreductase
MDFGLILPSYRAGASAEGVEAATETAERLGWHSVWTTDHLLPGPEAAEEYGTLLEAVTTLAYLGGRTRTIRLGASVIVVPMRNAVVLARELATIDVLTRGRLIAGVGVGWSEEEFRNVGTADRFRTRGAFTDETIAVWRHLWSGSSQPFEGRFHRFSDHAFLPLPARGGTLPVLVGGRSEGALRRAARFGDGYHASGSSPAQLAVRLPLLRQAAAAAGRPVPPVSARVRVTFGPATTASYQMAGTPEQIAGEILGFADQSVSMLAVDFAENDAERCAALVERFDREVVPLVREATAARTSAA